MIAAGKVIADNSFFPGYRKYIFGNRHVSHIFCTVFRGGGTGVLMMLQHPHFSGQRGKSQKKNIEKKRLKKFSEDKNSENKVVEIRGDFCSSRGWGLDAPNPASALRGPLRGPWSDRGEAV